MAKRNKNLLQRSRNWEAGSHDFDELPEFEKIRYSKQSRRGRAYGSKHVRNQR